MGAEKNLSEKIKMVPNFYGASTNRRLQCYTGDITAPLYTILTAQPNIPVYNADGSYYKYLGKDNALANLIRAHQYYHNKLLTEMHFLIMKL